MDKYSTEGSGDKANQGHLEARPEPRFLRQNASGEFDLKYKKYKDYSFK